MYAVIKTGGKQYRVEEGSVLSIDKLELGLDTESQFNEVLLVVDDEGNVKVGTPFVEGASVSFTVTDQYRGEKVRIVKFKRRKHHLKRAGHRSYLTKIRVTKIAA